MTRRHAVNGALDLIDDTLGAFGSYQFMPWQDDTGQRYLQLWGLLQALIIQQDAVALLAKTMGLNWKPSEDVELTTIRNTRNRVAGHPVFTRPKGQAPTHTVLSRREIEKEKFTVSTYDVDYQGGSETHCTLDLIAKQEEALASVMLRIQEQIRLSEDAFRKENAMNPISMHLTGSNYHLQNVWKATVGDGGRNARSGIVDAQHVLEQVSRLEADAISRKIDVGIEHIQRLRHVMMRLIQYFSADPAIFVNAEDADAWIMFAFQEVATLVDHCHQLDNEFRAAA